MKDKIIIQIELERINSSVGRINDLIRIFVVDLKKEQDVNVINYNLIETKFRIPDEKETKN